MVFEWFLSGFWAVFEWFLSGFWVIFSGYLVVCEWFFSVFWVVSECLLSGFLVVFEWFLSRFWFLCGFLRGFWVVFEWFFSRFWVVWGWFLSAFVAWPRNDPKWALGVDSEHLEAVVLEDHFLKVWRPFHFWELWKILGALERAGCPGGEFYVTARACTLRRAS